MQQRLPGGGIGRVRGERGALVPAQAGELDHRLGVARRRDERHCQRLGVRGGTAAGAAKEAERGGPEKDSRAREERPGRRRDSTGQVDQPIRSGQRDRPQREPGIGLGQDDDAVAVSAIELLDVLEIGDRLERHARGAGHLGR